MLTGAEKGEVLRLARTSVERAVREHAAMRRGLRSEPGAEAHSFHGALSEPRGAFVTIRVEGELRGCIGYIESLLPLGDVVTEVAAKAALEDPRFPPMTVEELERTTLEVSVLSSLERVTDIEAIEVGRHGLLLERDRYRGLLLPQVATEYGWDRTMFLESTCRKAGLPRDAWRDPETTIYCFSAEIIEEHHHGT